jgi:hypothetical protein
MLSLIVFEGAVDAAFVQGFMVQRFGFTFWGFGCLWAPHVVQARGSSTNKP